MRRIAASAVVLAVALLGAAPARAMPEPPVIKQWIDPFYAGLALNLTLFDRESIDFTARTLVLDANYAWESGFALHLEVPSEIADSRAGDRHYSIPTLAGNFTNEIEVQANYRLWGDVYDFVAVSMGAALPIASDDALRPTTQTMALLGVSAQLDWGFLRLNASVSDFSTFPDISDTTTGKTIYFDTSNYVQYSIQATVFPSNRLGVFLSWNEDSPRAAFQGQQTDPLEGADVVALNTPTSRVRHVDFGIELAPFTSRCVITLSGQEYEGWGADIANAPQWATAGALRWLF